jgi:hypothetical protein
MVLGNGHGPNRCRTPGPPFHRPASAFGSASASAHPPPATSSGFVLECITVTSSRLGGLLGGCGALLREGIPGEPHTALCPSKLERWQHNAVYRTPAGARCLVISGARDSGALRCTRKGATVKWGARGPRERCQSFRRLRFGRRHVASSSATTGSATRVSDIQRQRQASGTATVAVDSWWRGLPARAWTTTSRRDGRTAGRMPTAPWEAAPGCRRIPGTATGGPEGPAAASGSASAAASSARARHQNSA